MATYQVKADGKAQKGLAAGDEVVTGGGTYRITGVNADGSYRSERVSDVTTDTYRGSYAGSGSTGDRTAGGGKADGFAGSAVGVTTFGGTQDAIKEQMNANSQAWWNADAAGQARLHAENERLAQLLGGSVAYDSASGRWSGSAEEPVGQVNDLTAYLRELYRAQTEADLAALESAYRERLTELQGEAEKLPGRYDAAKNEAAAQAELRRRSFAEYAAARGLNSGTGGQAELARSAALQSALADLSAQQAQALSDQAAQERQLKEAYRTAVTQAKESGSSALANALYRELVRQAEAQAAASAAAQERQDRRAALEAEQKNAADQLALAYAKLYRQ